METLLNAWHFWLPKVSQKGTDISDPFKLLMKYLLKKNFFLFFLSDEINSQFDQIIERQYDFDEASDDFI